MKIYAIQEQNSIGCWELTGHAFSDSSEADTYVKKKQMGAIVAGLRYPQERCALADFADKDDKSVIAMTNLELLDLLKSLPEGYVNDFAGELQCGGFFSYEKLDIYDGKDPE